MAETSWNHIIRSPRHDVAEDTNIVVEIERTQQSSLDPIPANLCNVSRHGIQLELDHKFLDAEPVVVRIRDQKSDLELSIEATVLWQKEMGEANWLIGCVLACAMHWETYGELFLHHILKTELPDDDEPT